MDTVGPRDRFQGGQRFEAGVSRDFIARHLAHFGALFTIGFDHWHGYWHQLRVKTSVSNRSRRPQLGFQAELVSVLAADAVLGGDPFGAFELTYELEMFAIFPADRFAHPGLGA